ncbi:unnamed protein product [Rangifer tarandus platyrhynchus]|uniref:Uncharacterized protein n=2 Tax=Rangifer tarandus platyrhynchus TaxID=3082113 RepID=A0AC59Z5G1_RANTA|nr:unnamed protein product [Rangifer tarandus platyrhynchus]
MGTDGNRWEPWLWMGTSPGKVVCVWPVVILCARLSCQGQHWPVLGFEDWLELLGSTLGSALAACPGRGKEKDVGHPGFASPHCLSHLGVRMGDQLGLRP